MAKRSFGHKNHFPHIITVTFLFLILPESLGVLGVHNELPNSNSAYFAHLGTHGAPLYRQSSKRPNQQVTRKDHLFDFHLAQFQGFEKGDAEDGGDHQSLSHHRLSLLPCFRPRGTQRSRLHHHHHRPGGQVLDQASRHHIYLSPPQRDDPTNRLHPIF